jgi:hypothetical protein
MGGRSGLNGFGGDATGGRGERVVLAEMKASTASAGTRVHLPHFVFGRMPLLSQLRIVDGRTANRLAASSTVSSIGNELPSPMLGPLSAKRSPHRLSP